MKSRIKYILLSVGLVLSSFVANGQSRTIIEGLKSDAAYVQLCAEEERLVQRESELNKQLDELRKSVVAGTADANSLVALEMELFTIQSSLVDVRDEIGVKEQEWLLKNPDTVVQVSLVKEENNGFGGTGNNKVNLIYNPVFMENLPSGDYAALRQAQQAESQVKEYMDEYMANNDRIALLDSLYYTVKTVAEADSLYLERMRCDSLNGVIADKFTDLWNNRIYNVKSYSYNYLLDKNGMTDMLTDVEEMLGQMRIGMGNIDTDAVQDFVTYPHMKRFMLNYEIMLAQAMNNRGAADSLRKVVSQLKDDDYVVYSSQGPQRAISVEYIAASVEKTAPYNSKNPIPQVEMTDEPVYSLLLGRYSVAQNPSIFRNTNHLFYNRDENKRYCYYAGYYPTRQVADSAALYLKSKGFRNPIVTAWSERAQQEENVARTTSTKSSSGAKVSTVKRYRVEISNAGNALSQDLRTVISASAPDKELSRVMDAGNYIFFVGSFDDKSEADGLAAKLKEHSDVITIVVTEI